MKKNDYLKGIVFLMLAQSMVGINIVTSKFLLDSIPVLVLMTIRFALATMVLLPLHWLSPARQKPIKTYCAALTRRDWGFLIAQALSAGVLFNCLMLTGLSHTDAHVAGIITSALPAIIAIMSWLVLGETISAQKGLCVFFATVGLVIIAWNQLRTVGEAHSVVGDIIVLLSLLPEAAYYILCKVYSNRLPIFLVSAMLNGMNALLLLPSLFFVDWAPSSISVGHWFILFVIGLSSGLFYTFWFMGSKRVDGIMASLTTGIMPIATVVLAWILLGEQLTLVECLGMGLVIFSIVLYARR
jgi:drug/metabolite transporter (DMT)-like permease